MRTATKLLHHYGSLEDVLAVADKIPGSLGSKILKGKEAARLARRLVALCSSADVGANLKKFRYLVN